MTYTCPKCTEQFSDRTAYCENWRNKEKRFGCPHCKTFYIRKFIRSTIHTKILIAVLTSILLTAILFSLLMGKSLLFMLVTTLLSCYLGYRIMQTAISKSHRVELHLIDR